MFEPARAIEALNRAIELESGNQYTLSVRATAFAQIGEFDRALADLRAINEIVGENPETLAMMGRIYQHLGQDDEALAVADRAIAVDPDGLNAISTKAILLRSLGRDAEADAMFDRALEAVADMPADQISDRLRRDQIRSSVLATSGRIEEAVSELEALVAQQPGDPEILNWLCWQRVMANVQIEAALANCNEAIEMDPDREGVIDSRGWAKIRLGRYREAIEDFDRSLAISPQLDSSLYGRGLAHLRLGETEAAQADLARARLLSFDIDESFGLYGLAAEPAEAAEQP